HRYGIRLVANPPNVVNQRFKIARKRAGHDLTWRAGLVIFEHFVMCYPPHRRNSRASWDCVVSDRCNRTVSKKCDLGTVALEDHWLPSFLYVFSRAHGMHSVEAHAFNRV